MTYPWLPLELIEPAIPLMEDWGVSEVARSHRGFLTAFQRADGDPRALGRDSYSGQHWVNRRRGFIARHLPQGREAGWWEGGEPTRRHLALVAWAYTPTPVKWARFVERKL